MGCAGSATSLTQNPSASGSEPLTFEGVQDEYGLPFTVESNLSPAMKQIEVQEDANSHGFVGVVLTESLFVSIRKRRMRTWRNFRKQKVVQ
mmetsp:Transcript_52819/g.109229  ORF Transcript_52819/g.109229 Transcript_52819/m.109229 type:complete len:91 (+) Transcript_52819:79-351(+)